MLSVSRPSPSSYRESHPRQTGGTLLLALPEETSITINIVPSVKRAPETTQCGRVALGSSAQGQQTQ